MRVALVTESFLPEINGVTNSVLRVVEHLERNGHDALVLAPGKGPTTYAHATVVRVRGVPIPLYKSLSLGLPSRRVEAALRLFRPDVAHLASPFCLGPQALSSLERLGVPSVAIYQTDVAGFLANYGLRAASGAAWRWLRRIHQRADRTLAPSTAAVADLEHHGVRNVHLWSRGVDGQRFSPHHRDEAFRRRLAPNGELIVGYIGRLASEKRVELLTALEELPGCRVVIVGDGPLRQTLEQRLPHATFLGFQDGAELSRTFASLDVFVHTGTEETFCQAIQEALASGVPAVAPAVGGPLDLVAHERNGLLVNPGDSTALRDAVTRLVTTPELRRALRDQARQSVAGRTWEAIGDQLLEHYQAVIQATRKRVA